jgi:TP901 family phage tail tape measure protein
MAASMREVFLLLRARDEASRVVRGFATELSRAGLSGIGLARGFMAAGMALETLGIGFVFAGTAGVKFFVDSFNSYREYQRQVALTKTQTDGFAASLHDLSKIGLDVAKNIAVPFEQIQPALYDIFSTTSANLTQGRMLLTAFSKAAVAGQVDIQAASRATMAIMNAYNIPLEKVNDVLDVQFQLVRKGVGTYGEFSSVIGNVIPAATRAGQSVQTVAAMLAYLTRNGLSAAMAATSSARALEALSNPKTVSRLKDMGIAFYDASGQARPLADVLLDIRKRLDTMPAPDKVKAITELLKGAGGTIQARRFLEQVLLRPGELEDFIGFLGDMTHASGQFEKAYGQMSDTAEAKTQLLSNKWKALKVNIGELVAPALLQLIGAVSKVLDWFDKLDPSLQKALTTFALWASVGAVVLGVFLTILGVLALIVGAFAFAGTAILVVTGVVAGLTAGLALLVGGFIAAWKHSETFRDIVKGSIQEVRNKAGELWNEISKDYNKFVKPALDDFRDAWDTRIKSAVDDFIAFWYKTGKHVFDEVADTLKNEIAPAFQTLGDVIQHQIIPALDNFSTWWNENKAVVKPLLHDLSELGAVLVGMIASGAVSFLFIFAGGLVAFGNAAFMVSLQLRFLTAEIRFLVEMWDALKQKTGGTWQAIIALVAGPVAILFDILSRLNGKIDEVKRKWDEFKSGIANVMATAQSLVAGGVANILGQLGRLSSVPGTVERYFSQMASTIAGWINTAISYVASFPSRAAGAVGSLGGVLVGAGRSLVQGLISGIESEIGSLISTVSTLAGIIAAHKGPREYDLILLRPAGRAIMTGLIAGIQDEVPTLINQLENVSGAMSVGPYAFSSNASAGSSNAPSMQQYITINTQEIDPRVHAEQLGWRLANRVGIQ